MAQVFSLHSTDKESQNQLHAEEMQINLSPKGFLTILLSFLLMEWYCSIRATEICLHVSLMYCMKAKFVCNGQRKDFIVIVCIYNDGLGKHFMFLFL